MHLFYLYKQVNYIRRKLTILSFIYSAMFYKYLFNSEFKKIMKLFDMEEGSGGFTCVYIFTS